MKKTMIFIAAMLLATTASLKAEDISVVIPEQSIVQTTTNMIINVENGVHQNPKDGSWTVNAKVELSGQGTVTTNGTTKIVYSQVRLTIHISRAEIAAHYSVTLEEYDNLTIKQLRDAVWAIAPVKAIIAINTPIVPPVEPTE